MKRILITGATSWIGSEVEAHLAAFPGMYGVERVSLRGDAWKDRSWEGFDSVVHLAAVVHESGKAGGMGGLYDEVNVALVRQAALKAKTEGVPHFAFLSSFSVYGAEEGGVEEVDLGAVPRPSTLYGKSKLAARSPASTRPSASSSEAPATPWRPASAGWITGSRPWRRPCGSRLAGRLCDEGEPRDPHLERRKRAARPA